MATPIDFTPCQPVTITVGGTSSGYPSVVLGPLAEAISVSGYDYLDLELVVLFVSGSGLDAVGVTIGLTVGTQTQTEDGWANNGTNTTVPTSDQSYDFTTLGATITPPAVSVVPKTFGPPSEGMVLLPYARWVVRYESTGSSTATVSFYIRGMARRIGSGRTFAALTQAGAVTVTVPGSSTYLGPLDSALDIGRYDYTDLECVVLAASIESGATPSIAVGVATGMQNATTDGWIIPDSAGNFSTYLFPAVTSTVVADAPQVLLATFTSVAQAPLLRFLQWCIVNSGTESTTVTFRIEGMLRQFGPAGAGGGGGGGGAGAAAVGRIGGP